MCQAYIMELRLEEEEYILSVKTQWEASKNYVGTKCH